MTEGCPFANSSGKGVCGHGKGKQKKGKWVYWAVSGQAY